MIKSYIRGTVVQTFYCNICDKDVVLKNGVCPYCQTNWKQIINNCTSNQTEDNSNDYTSNQIEDISNDYEILVINDEDIEKNIRFHLSFAKVIVIVGVIISIFVLIITLGFVSETIKISGFISFIVFVIGIAWILTIAIITVVVNNALKWKAYMLYTISKSK